MSEKEAERVRGEECTRISQVFQDMETRQQRAISGANETRRFIIGSLGATRMGGGGG